jgi:hypothetical protein
LKPHTITCDEVSSYKRWYEFASSTTTDGDGAHRKALEIAVGQCAFRVTLRIVATEQTEVKYEGPFLTLAVDTYNGLY